MIFYEPNKNWFRDLRNLTTSWTLQKVFYGVSMVGGLSLVICFSLYYFEIQPRLGSGIFSLLGIILSIILVFRTNTAYDRWWEGRKQWGDLVNNLRTLAIILQACLPKEDKSNRLYFAKHISNFAIALKEHLRSGTKPDYLFLNEEETRELNDKQHRPNYIALLIYNRMQVIYKAGAITDADMINLKPHHQAMLDVMGACERIKRTPIPFSYAVFIKMFISIYAIMLPFGLYMDFGFYTIPLTMFISFAMIGLELMAQEIEEPFGLDCNDLPTGDIATTIEKNVFETLEQDHEKVSAVRQLYSKIF